MLPMLYHAHHNLHREDLPFWLELASQSSAGSAAPARILELGCGTGRVFLPLSEHGHTVFGLDHDRAMLATLRQNLPTAAFTAAGLEPPLPLYIIQADFTALPIRAHSFDLILMPCNTYSTLSAPVRLACLEAAQRILDHRRPGRFAFSIPNPTLLRRLPAQSAPEIEEIFTHPTGGEPVQVSSAWQRTREFFTVTWRYDHLLPDGQVERFSTQVCHHLLALPQILEELNIAGFQQTAIYGDYDRSPYTEHSPYAIIIVQVS